MKQVKREVIDTLDVKLKPLLTERKIEHFIEEGDEGYSILPDPSNEPHQEQKQIDAYQDYIEGLA